MAKQRIFRAEQGISANFVRAGRMRQTGLSQNGSFCFPFGFLMFGILCSARAIDEVSQFVFKPDQGALALACLLQGARGISRLNLTD